MKDLQSLKITIEDVKNELARRKYNKIESYFQDVGPFKRSGYSKHLEFFAHGKNFRERTLMAANRVGKTEGCGGYEITCHATGIYPSWWDGRRFDKPVRILVGGETAKLVRDSIQLKLLGPLHDKGCGLIPLHCIENTTSKAGIPQAVDEIFVKHVKGTSVIQFQSYDQGREVFQATERDIVWFDEEPPEGIYAEGLIRTMTTNGMVISTFTPLKGVTATVLSLQDKAEKGIGVIVSMTWDDAPHLSESDKKDLMESLPPHQREARSKGIPALGSGAVYPVTEDRFVISPIMFPKHWKRCFGMDVGWNFTAGAWLAIDPETDVAYMYAEYKQGKLEAPIHAEGFKSKGAWIPGVIDPAASGSSQHDGTNLIDKYVALGLKLQHADNSVEAGIFEIHQRLATGRLKIFNTCHETLSEYRLYRRDEKGKIVKQNDHCFTGETIVHTELGPSQIKDLVGTNGYLLSLNGKYEAYNSCRKTRENTEVLEIMFSDGSTVKSTPDHRFLTTKGFVKAVDLTDSFCYDSVTEREKSCDRSYLQRLPKNLRARATIYAGSISKEMGLGCIDLYGKLRTIRESLMAFISIISTTTEAITTRKTYNYFPLKTISAVTSSGCRTQFQTPPLSPLRCGTDQRMALSGTVSITRILGISFMKRLRASAAYVVKHIARRVKTQTASAVTLANQLTEEKQGWIISKGLACLVQSYSRLTVIQRQKPVQGHALLQCIGVRKLPILEDVYCLSVPANNLFAVGAGVVVHNCLDSLRYAVNSGISIAKTNIDTAKKMNATPANAWSY